MKNKCLKCGYEWPSRNPDQKPVQCPRCKRYDWDKKEEEQEDGE